MWIQKFVLTQKVTSEFTPGDLDEYKKYAELATKYLAESLAPKTEQLLGVLKHFCAENCFSDVPSNEEDIVVYFITAQFSHQTLYLYLYLIIIWLNCLTDLG